MEDLLGKSFRTAVKTMQRTNGRCRENRRAIHDQTGAPNKIINLR